MIFSEKEIESIESCYFGPRYNLTKPDIIDNLERSKKSREELIAKLITPRSVVGTGYKNARKTAMEWLDYQISLQEYLLKHFDTKNQLVQY